MQNNDPDLNTFSPVLVLGWAATQNLAPANGSMQSLAMLQNMLPKRKVGLPASERATILPLEK